MQSCDEILDLLSAALDDQLSADEQAALNQHLASCPACSALFDELRELHEASAQLEDIAAPTGFAQQVMNCIAADPAQEQSGQVIPFPTKKVSRNSWKKWAASAAAVAIVALGAVSLPGQFRATKSDTADQAKYMSAELCDQVAFDAAPESAPGKYDYGHSVQVQSSAVTSGECKTDDEVQTIVEPAYREPVTLCGTLYLTDDRLPDGLDEFQSKKAEDGNLHYYVSSDYFFSLKDQGYFTDNFEDITLGSSDAKHGLIIVKPAS